MNGTFLMLGPAGFGVYRVAGDQFTPSTETPEGILTPGLVDLHIHGAFGVDFMSAGGKLLDLCDKLEAEGYEAWLPTTVTGSADDVKRALAELPEHRSIAGFHLEGPFISPEYPGAQPPGFILDPPSGPGEWDEVLDDSRLKLITLAPERPGALALIDRLVARGVRCSLGHTNATCAEARVGWERGARHATHTFNAMRPLHHREAGTVGFVLGEPTMDAELIYDRHHVSPDAARVLFAAKGLDSVIAVSDSTMAAGLPAGTELTMWGLECKVGDKQIRLASNGALAGSAITLKDAFQNLAEDFGPEVAVRACCHNPRRAIGLPAEPRVQLIWSLDFELRDRVDR